MDSDTAKKPDAVHRIAGSDPICRERKKELRLGGYEMEMTDPQRDAMWDFFDALEGVNNRLMELACRMMEFPKGSNL